MFDPPVGKLCFGAPRTVKMLTYLLVARNVLGLGVRVAALPKEGGKASRQSNKGHELMVMPRV